MVYLPKSNIFLLSKSMSNPSIPEDRLEDQPGEWQKDQLGLTWSKNPNISGQWARMRDKVLNVMGSTLHDHLIIINTNCVSFKSLGHL